jgi:hypothetical protein
VDGAAVVAVGVLAVKADREAVDRAPALADRAVVVSAGEAAADAGAAAPIRFRISSTPNPTRK